MRTAYRLMTLAYPWLGLPMEILRIRRISAVPFLIGHATQILVYYVMYEGVQVSEVFWFRINFYFFYQLRFFLVFHVLYLCFYIYFCFCVDSHFNMVLQSQPSGLIGCVAILGHDAVRFSYKQTHFHPSF